MSNFVVKISPNPTKIKVNGPNPDFTVQTIGTQGPPGKDGIVYTVLIVTAAGTTTLLTTSHNYVEMNSTLGNQTLLLPDATLIIGQVFTIKKIDSSINTVTISPQFSQTLDNAASFLLDWQWDSITVVSNGTEWRLI